jgi:hypothetical protein
MTKTKCKLPCSLNLYFFLVCYINYMTAHLKRNSINTQHTIYHQRIYTLYLTATALFEY